MAVVFHLLSKKNAVKLSSVDTISAAVLALAHMKLLGGGGWSFVGGERWSYSLYTGVVGPWRDRSFRQEIKAAIQ